MDNRFHHMREIMLRYDFHPEEKKKSWLLPHLVVQVGEEGKGAFLGITREIIDDEKCLVALRDSDDGEHVVVSLSELKMVVPQISDEVKIVRGKFRHMMGQLVDITNEGQHGLVLLDSLNEIKFVRMEKIGKLAYMNDSAKSDSRQSGENLQACLQDVQQKVSTSDSGGTNFQEEELLLVTRENDPALGKAEGGGSQEAEEGEKDGFPQTEASDLTINRELMETENVNEHLPDQTQDSCNLLGETKGESSRREEHSDDRLSTEAMDTEEVGTSEVVGSMQLKQLTAHDNSGDRSLH